MTLHRARVGLAGAAVLVVTSGCGVAGTDFQPGAAATVGGAELPSGTVNEYAGYFCDALESEAFGDVGAVARSELKQGVAGNLTRRLAAEQLAEQYAVDPGEYYQRVRAEAQQDLGDLGDLSQEATEALVEVQTTDAYVNGVALAVGERVLVEEGEENPGPQAAQARGAAVFTQWLAEQDVEIDPALGVELAEDGTWARADTAASVPGSDLAVVAGLGAVDEAGQPIEDYAAYVSSLPASQRCG